MYDFINSNCAEIRKGANDNMSELVMVMVLCLTDKHYLNQLSNLSL